MVKFVEIHHRCEGKNFVCGQIFSGSPLQLMHIIVQDDGIADVFLDEIKFCPYCGYSPDLEKKSGNWVEENIKEAKRNREKGEGKWLKKNG